MAEKKLKCVKRKEYFPKFLNLFVWMSGFQKSLAHTDVNMFVDEWTSANESPIINSHKTGAFQTHYLLFTFKMFSKDTGLRGALFYRSE